MLSGLLFFNQCDDGNDQDGDGCSSSCQIEDSFFCLKQSEVDAYQALGLFDPLAFAPDFQKVGIDLPKDPDTCYRIGNHP
jgi:cysteine-rich repeat protein